MTPADELQLGRLIGKVEALADTVETMRTENAADHQGVARRLDTIDAKLDGKASETWVQQHEDRIDRLEQRNDQSAGKSDLIFEITRVFLGPLVVGIVVGLVVGVLLLVVTKGAG